MTDSPPPPPMTAISSKPLSGTPISAEPLSRGMRVVQPPKSSGTLPALSLLAIAMCATCGWPLPAGAQTTEPGDKVIVAKAEADLTPELMYRLLVADIALQRGQPALAARAYYEAAKEGRSAVFARRATEI